MAAEWYSNPGWTPEPIIGYRGWNWSHTQQRLIGANGYAWESARLKAVDTQKQHSAPYPGCLCGINAYKDPLGPRRFNIIGKVHLTGIVDEYDRGYRAEHGEIKEIFIYAKHESTVHPDRLRELMETSGPFPVEHVDRLIEEIYGVPVIRAKRIGWREMNREATLEEQSDG